MYLKWSEFEWFKKNAKIPFGDSHFICSESKGKDQKIIFPIKDQQKYLTFSTSEKYLDMHLTHENRCIPQKNIFEIRVKNIKNVILQESKKIQLSTFIPFRDKKLRSLIFVDPRSNKFIKNIEKTNNGNLLPTTLLRTRITSMSNKHGKILLALDKYGKLQGIIRCNHRNYGFDFVPIAAISAVQNRLIRISEIKSKLREIGLKENMQHIRIWERWNKFLKFLQLVQKSVKTVIGCQ